MPRKARQESSTGMYHVVMRGNNRSWILKKFQHKKKMKALIIEQEKQGLCELYAWCIMDNHVHIVLKAKKDLLFRTMWNINRLFARNYNYKEKQVGHVFENRYKSEVVETDAYLKQVIRYVHNNPVKAKMVTRAEDYKWSSYNEYFEGVNESKVINIINGYFHNDIKEFIKYHKKEDYDECLEIKEDIEKQRGEKAQAIISSYCKIYHIKDVSELHNNIDVRNDLIRKIIAESGLSLKRIAQITGMSYSTIKLIKKEVSNE